jgi:hypothetical protein
VIRLLTISLVLAAAGAAIAATPRVQALGGDGAYLEDTGNVLRWSGSLTDHDGRCTVASGTFDGDGYPPGAGRVSGPWVGVQAGMGEPERRSAVALYAWPRGADAGSSNLAGTGSGKGFHGVAARRFGAWTGGLAFRSEQADEEHFERRLELGAGSRIDLGAGAYIDLAVERLWLERGADRSCCVASAADPAPPGYGLRARAFFAVTPALVVTPLVSLTRANREWRLDGDWSRPWSVHHFRLGAAATWLPDPDRLVVVSVDHRATGTEGPAPLAETDALLVRLALEARLNAFLSLRTAAGWEEREAPDASLAPLSLGLGVHAWDWDLDLAVATVPPLDAAGRRPRHGAPAPGWLSAALSYTF